jgi:hypothetical protein
LSASMSPSGAFSSPPEIMGVSWTL